MQQHPEPESHPPPLPPQRPVGESVTEVTVHAGRPLVLGGVHGRRSACTTLRVGPFADGPGDRQHGSIPARMVPHLVSYVGVMVVLVLVWLLVGVHGGGWYPWPVWPALGWGAGIVCKLAAHGGVRCAAQ